tara:strand:- start:316 stop:630 length:315 start_codon:yes stop_codon:yes gene_type:complete
MTKRVKTIHIGKKDIYEWTMDEGKSTLMQLLFESSKKLINGNEDEIRAVRIEAEIRGAQTAFDFWVRLDDIDDTLSKIMEWALEEEKYEMCQEIKKLESKIQNF